MSRWFIIRTSGGHTLPLMKSLRAAGFDVWTPAHEIRKVIRRGTPHQKVLELDAPIMPTFVFAPEPLLEQLAAIAGERFSPHPQFSIFCHGGRAPLVRDADIAGLQAAEAEAAATMRAIRDAETHAEAERIRIAAIKSEAARRRATKELERRQAAERRQKPCTVAVGDEVEILEAPAFAGVAGVVEATNHTYAEVRFGNRSLKIDGWRLTPSTLKQAA